LQPPLFGDGCYPAPEPHQTSPNLKSDAAYSATDLFLAVVVALHFLKKIFPRVQWCFFIQFPILGSFSVIRFELINIDTIVPGVTRVNEDQYFAGRKR
jgi:hypothetical protein